MFRSILKLLVACSVTVFAFVVGVTALGLIPQKPIHLCYHDLEIGIPVSGLLFLAVFVLTGRLIRSFLR